MNELRLWFSITDGVFYVHDYWNHKVCMIVALRARSGWVVRMPPKTFGHQLVKLIVAEPIERRILTKVRELYEKFGTYNV